MSKSHKVLLQGDGGDELFGGYTRYRTVLLFFYFRPLINSIFHVVKLFNIPVGSRLMRFLKISQETTLPRIHAALMTVEPVDFSPYKYMSDTIKSSTPKAPHYDEYEKAHLEFEHIKEVRQKILLVDFKIILKDTFFEKVDKSTMANSIEVRVPFIDNQLVGYVQSIPARKKLSYFRSKPILRKVLRGELPLKVIRGKKRGFGVPYATWLKEDLRLHFQELLKSEKSKQLINVEEVEETFRSFLAGKSKEGFLLWKIYILLIWFNKRNVILK